MTSSKNTKRALLASILSMLLCAAMLAGSTFAWFTDSVTSGKNKIVAGSLDVELEYTTDFNTWNTVEDATNLFQENALWEPGYAEAVYLRVRNAGTLALKYQFGINIESEQGGVNAAGEEFLLSDYLKYGVAAGQTSVFASRADAIGAVEDNAAPLSGYTANGNLTAGSEDTLALVVYMPESVGNEANYRGEQIPTIELGISVVATQDTVEEDGFGNDYDADAKFPSVIQIPADKTLDGTTGEITNLSGNTVVTASNNTLTFGNNSDIGEATAVDMNGTSQAVKNSIKAEDGQSLTMINGELVKSTTFGKVRFDTNGKEQTGLFENMTFTDTSAPTHTGSSSNDTEQMIQICPNGGGAGTYIFRNCTFNDAYVLVSGINGGAAVDIIFENCTFNNTGNADAIELNPAYVNSGSVTIKDCTFNLVTTSNIYAVDMSGTSKINLTFEGENRVNGTVADDSKYNLFPTTSVTAYNCKNVTGAENVTVSGIATKP